MKSFEKEHLRIEEILYFTLKVKIMKTVLDQIAYTFVKETAEMTQIIIKYHIVLPKIHFTYNTGDTSK